MNSGHQHHYKAFAVATMNGKNNDARTSRQGTATFRYFAQKVTRFSFRERVTKRN